MPSLQPGILQPPPRAARHLTFVLRPASDPRAELARLAELNLGDEMVVGLGPSTVSALGAKVPGLREPPVLSAAGLSLPVTPGALWCWLRGEDRGVLLHGGRQLQELLAPSYQLQSIRDTFLYAGGRDLTGYEDGTENPKREAATAAAMAVGHGAGLDGGSFAALQVWVHDLVRFESFSPERQDALMGRRRRDNAELDDAPASAHVKRSAQESYQPAAFLLRRSMPWTEGEAAGLAFLAFGHSFDAFEAILRRMIGCDDAIADGLFQYSRPLSTAYFWCPPLQGTQLDLSALGL